MGLDTWRGRGKSSRLAEGRKEVAAIAVVAPVTKIQVGLHRAQG